MVYLFYDIIQDAEIEFLLQRFISACPDFHGQTAIQWFAYTLLNPLKKFLTMADNYFLSILVKQKIHI
jgi:hypothetical protein